MRGTTRGRRALRAVAEPDQHLRVTGVGLLGAAAALASAGLAYGATDAARWWLDRRCIDEWGREWDLIGPRWGHKTG